MGVCDCTVFNFKRKETRKRLREPFYFLTFMYLTNNKMTTIRFVPAGGRHALHELRITSFPQMACHSVSRRYR